MAEIDLKGAIEGYPQIPNSTNRTLNPIQLTLNLKCCNYN